MKHKIFSFLALLCVTALTAGCAAPKQAEDSDQPGENARIQIGMSFDTFVLERWLRDRDVFVSTAEELGADVNVQNANGDPQEQVAQLEYLIEKNVDVLVVVAIDTNDGKLIDVLRTAMSRGIRVIAYDRCVSDADVDLHVSFDNEKIGTLMAEAVLSQMKPDGKLAIFYGSPTDNNVGLVKQGIKKELKKAGITPVYENYADNWKAEFTYGQMTECLEQNGPVDAVICGNDALAAMAFKALSEHRLADDVTLVGQDADIDACQRIAEGTQYMTVYKSIDDLARETAQYAVKLAEDQPLDIRETFFDGTYDVPYLKLDPVAVTQENLDSEIIDSRFHLRSEVYLNVDD